MRDMLSTCEEYRAETEVACGLRVTKIDSLDSCARIPYVCSSPKHPEDKQAEDPRGRWNLGGCISNRSGVTRGGNRRNMRHQSYSGLWGTRRRAVEKR